MTPTETPIEVEMDYINPYDNFAASYGNENFDPVHVKEYGIIR